MTEVALLPAALVGIDSHSNYEGAHEIYRFFTEDNDSFRAASILFQLEQQGITDVFMPFYDKHLFDLKHLFVQLCHESFGKDGKGQTYFAHEAPESQHHTNQRFFGGPKNIAGWFLSVEQPVHSLRTIVPKELRDVPIKHQFLSVIDQIPLETALQFECQATMEDARIHGIPLLHQSVVQRTPHEIGRLIAFWQMYAVYASTLRGVNPFDQPQVEASKRISFDKRLKYKKLL
jgi:glucose-6-phosphate isomerase